MFFTRKLLFGLMLAISANVCQLRGATFEVATDGVLKEIHARMNGDSRRTLFFDAVSVPVQGTEAGLRKDFTERLKQHSELKSRVVDNRLKADTMLDVTLVKDVEGTQALLKVRLRDQNLKDLVDYYSDPIDNVADLTRLLNFTVNQRVPGDDKTGEGLSDREKIKAAETIVEGKQELLKQAFARSSVHVSSNGFRASTDALSPYQVEIRTKDSNGEFKVSQPIKIVKDASGNDFAFVDLALGTVFAVRVLNAQGDHDVGVRVLLDGISSFELSEIEQYKQRDCWYVPKNVAGMIKGWFVNEKLTKSFETSTLAEGLITELKRSDLSSVGTITVSFFPAWAGDAEPPVVEKSVTTKAIKSGKDVPNQVKIVDDIQFGKTLLSSITIRYERPTGSNVAESAQAKR